MDLFLVGIALVTFLSTLLGGVLALRFRGALHYFFAFASGSLIAVTFFDLLPESLELASSVHLPVRTVMTVVVASFFFYSLVEKFFLTHHGHEEEEKHGHPMGPIGAGSLVIHSFLDGLAIGASFLVNPAVGVIVALAVIFHDFTDGINTVTLMLKNRHSTKSAWGFLLADAVAPVLGMLVASLLGLPEWGLALLLAFFAGEFLYIGASNLLPETHHHPTLKMTAAMGSAILLIYGLTAIL